MALLYCDSFDFYDGNYDLKRFDGSSANNIYPTSGRRGGGCIRMGYGGLSEKNIPSGPLSTVIIGIAIKELSALTTPSYDLLAFMDEGNKQIVIKMANDVVGDYASLEAYRGTTLIGTSATKVLTSAVWQYLEAKVVIHASAGSVVIKLDEVTVLNLTGIDTLETANATVDSIRIANYSAGYIYVDDLYICDTTGSYNNDFLGNIKVEAHLPDADGTHTDFACSTGTDHHALVDEASTNETDYNTGDAVDEIDSYGITVGDDLGTILGVQITSYAWNPDVGSRKVKNLLRSNSADYLGGNELLLNNTGEFVEDIWERDPDDSAAFTKTKLDAMEIGLKVTE